MGSWDIMCGVVCERQQKNTVWCRCHLNSSSGNPTGVAEKSRALSRFDLDQNLSLLRLCGTHKYQYMFHIHAREMECKIPP